MIDHDETPPAGKQILVVVAPEAGRGALPGREATIRSLPVERIRESLAETLAGLQDVFEDLAERRAQFPLKEIELSFEITASGSVAILGTGAQMEGRGGIVLRFGQR